MIQVSAYGRLGQDPRAIETRSGKAMSVASLAVQPSDEFEEPLWLNVVAFNRLAERLLKHSKGECLSVCGRVQRNTYTTRDGEAREQLQIIADAIVSARIVSPGNARKRQPKGEEPAASGRSSEAFDDDIRI